MEGKFLVRRIGIASSMRVGASIFALLGFIFGILWGIASALFSSFVGMLLGRPSPEVNALFLISSIVFNTISWAIMGAIGAFLFVLVYNLAAGAFGGIELEIDNQVIVYAEEPHGVTHGIK